MLRLTGLQARTITSVGSTRCTCPRHYIHPGQETLAENPKHTTAPVVAIKQPSSLPHYGTNNPAPPALKLKWDSYPPQGSSVGAACTARSQANLQGLFFFFSLMSSCRVRETCLLVLSSRPENQRPCELRNKGRWLRWGPPSWLDLSNIYVHRGQVPLGMMFARGGGVQVERKGGPELEPVEPARTSYSPLTLLALLCINLPALPASLLISAPLQMRCWRRHSVDAGGSSLCIPATTAACDLRLGS